MLNPETPSDFPYECGISEVEGEWMWSASFDDTSRDQRGRENTFPEAWRKMEAAIRIAKRVA